MYSLSLVCMFNNKKKKSEVIASPHQGPLVLVAHADLVVLVEARDGGVNQGDERRRFRKRYLLWYRFFNLIRCLIPDLSIVNILSVFVSSKHLIELKNLYHRR